MTVVHDSCKWQLYLFSIFAASLRASGPFWGRPFEPEPVAARFRLFFEARVFRSQMPFAIQIQENLKWQLFDLKRNFCNELFRENKSLMLLTIKIQGNQENWIFFLIIFFQIFRPIFFR
jgi:hypothetical protein